MTRAMNRLVLAAAVLCLTAVASFAQTTTTETKAFEVLALSGNQLVVKLPEGTREITVPEGFRFTVNGQQLAVSDLKVGMKGTANITTRTTVTPVTVTEVKNGTVVEKSGSNLIVRTDEGVKMFSQSELDKRGVRIFKDGKLADVTSFHAGDKVSAVIITSLPPRVMTEKEVQATLAAAPAPARSAAPAASRAGGSGTPGATSSTAATPGTTATAGTTARAGAAPSPAPAAPAARANASPAATTLPKTASRWPSLWLASVLSLAVGIGLTLRRYAVR